VTTPLDRALQSLIAFLTATPVDDYWLHELTRVQRAMTTADTRATAVTELRSWFAGMGSLNDLWYSGANVPPGSDVDRLNAELNCRLDALFYEIGVAGRPWMRLLFGWVARRRSGTIPLRVFGAFSLAPPPSAAARPPGWWNWRERARRDGGPQGGQ